MAHKPSVILSVTDKKADLIELKNYIKQIKSELKVIQTNIREHEKKHARAAKILEKLENELQELTSAD
jgi:chromosome segregation ATPase